MVELLVTIGLYILLVVVITLIILVAKEDD